MTAAVHEIRSKVFGCTAALDMWSLDADGETNTRIALLRLQLHELTGALPVPARPPAIIAAPWLLLERVLDDFAPMAKERRVDIEVCGQPDFATRLDPDLFYVAAAYVLEAATRVALPDSRMRVFHSSEPRVDLIEHNLCFEFHTPAAMTVGDTLPLSLAKSALAGQGMSLHSTQEELDAEKDKCTLAIRVFDAD